MDDAALGQLLGEANQAGPLPAQATRILLLSPGSPVEVMTALDGWLRVREPGGRLAWAESKAVVTRRTLMVSVASATIRGSAHAQMITGPGPGPRPGPP